VIYGEVTVVCDRDLSKQYPSLAVNRPGQPQQRAFINLLRCIQSLPQGLVNELTDSELRDILSYFQFGHAFFNMLNSYCRGSQLAMTALNDLNASAKMVTATPPEYGPSRWASLQAAEKFLKYYMESNKTSFPHTHVLNIPVGQAVRLGLPEIDESVIAAAQCSAQVRYTEQAQSVVEVVAAHRAAMRIGSTVVDTLHSKR
jgi:predicted thioesterase